MVDTAHQLVELCQDVGGLAAVLLEGWGNPLEP
jgi:hypothetical protein